MSSEERRARKLRMRISQLEQRKESFVELIMDVRKKLHKDERKRRHSDCDGMRS